jgi:hypothetical protein
LPPNLAQQQRARLKIPRARFFPAPAGGRYRAARAQKSSYYSAALVYSRCWRCSYKLRKMVNPDTVAAIPKQSASRGKFVSYNVTGSWTHINYYITDSSTYMSFDSSKEEPNDE